MTKTISDMTFQARRWRGLVISGCTVLTMMAIQLLGINYQFQILIGAIFIPLVVLSYVRSTMERQGDIKPAWLKTSVSSVTERRKSPSGSSQNSFDFDSSTLTLDERITVVADVCRQYGRRVSVIHFRFQVSDLAAFERVPSVLRACLRQTDYVESVGEKEIVVCLNMIRGLAEAELVMKRIAAALEKNRIDRAEWNAGCAMYPIHGYSGVDLINFARNICMCAVEERNRLADRVKGEAGQDSLSGAGVGEVTRTRGRRSSREKTAAKSRGTKR
jgi:hypothetical protein